MTADPAISVVVPTFNREKLLPRALDSILSQTFDDWEIVLVDDGSTDNTTRLVADYQRRVGDRMVYLRRPHRGVNWARNHGIDECRGRFVAFLDSDDEFLPDKLQRQLDLFEKRPELGLVYGDYAFVDLDGVRFNSAFDTHIPLAREVPFEEIAPRLCVCTESVFNTLVHGYFIATIVGMVRRDVLADSIRFPTDCGYSEEWLFYLRVARACRAGFVNEPLCLHHFTGGSLTRTDKHRNSVRYGKLLDSINKEFIDLNPTSRKALHLQLALNQRQLGYDALRARNSSEAVHHFRESLRFQPTFEACYRLGHAGLLTLLGQSSRSGRHQTVSQDESIAVR